MKGKIGPKICPFQSMTSQTTPLGGLYTFAPSAFRLVLTWVLIRGEPIQPQGMVVLGLVYPP